MKKLVFTLNNGLKEEVLHYDEDYDLPRLLSFELERYGGYFGYFSSIEELPWHVEDESELSEYDQTQKILALEALATSPDGYATEFKPSLNEEYSYLPGKRNLTDFSSEIWGDRYRYIEEIEVDEIEDDFWYEEEED